MSKFTKVSELAGEDRTKLKGYWKDLFGPEYANAMVTDFKPDGKEKKVEARGKKIVK
ncbi:MAG TPA: hypothetical protein VMX17_14975 [Candidatus Glassbacteria bacterium]|nr:hypothetical protein [Candidatus Glassbacteria bacterium]